MGRTLTQLRMLLWKNFMLQRRRPIGTVFEILFPCVLFAILYLARSRLASDRDAPIAFASQPAQALDLRRNYIQEGQEASGIYANAGPIDPGILMLADYKYFAYAPAGVAEVEDIIDRMETELNYMYNPSSSWPFTNITYTGVATEAEIEALGTDPDKKLLCAVVFFTDDGHGQRTETLGVSSATKQFHYKLRCAPSLVDAIGDGEWHTDRNFPEFEEPRPFADDLYHYSGFLAVQTAVDRAIAAHLHPQHLAPQTIVRTKAFPFPDYVNDSFFGLIRGVFPFILVLSYVYTVMMMTRTVVYEKEKRLKEAMKMMGVNNWIHWTAWFLKTLLFFLPTIIIMTLILVGGKVLQHCSAGLVFILLLFFAVATIAFCFFLSTIFSAANTATAASGLLFFLCYLPYSILARRYSGMSNGQRALLCLLAPSGVGVGANIISKYESAGLPLTLTTMYDTPFDGDTFAFVRVLGMLALDALIYGVLTWYIETVHPGQYGVAKPWYFFVTRAYWCGHGPQALDDSAAGDGRGHNAGDANVEPAPPGLHAGIAIQNLRKTFRAHGFEKTAVDGLSLDFYEGQITALLGHNGAGKTTTLSILVGLFMPSSGTAVVNGYDIRTDMDKVHDSLGLCPQFDVLFDSLTVAEHLEFFTRLKGADAATVRTETDTFLRDLDLGHKRNAPASTLSGGQKRGLSVALALAGGSKIVILDEPTSGMDPYKRRHTWDLLLKHKEGRTILLTTHFMDEADLLGDRIAIMAEGQLRAAGSSMFLKSRFGVGYHLTLVKRPACHTPTVTATVLKHVATARLTGDVGAELTYLLPKAAVASFPTLFSAIEDSRDALGVDSFGVSVTTMEEVFLRVGSGEGLSDDDRRAAIEHAHASRLAHADSKNAYAIAAETKVAAVATAAAFGFGPHDVELAPLSGGGPAPTKTGFVRAAGKHHAWLRFKALFVKKAIIARRSLRTAIAQIALPVFFTIIALAIARDALAKVHAPERALSLTPYGETSSFVSARDLGGDAQTLQDFTLRTQVAYMANRTTNAHATALHMRTGTFFASDARASDATLADYDGVNVTATLLAAAGNFLETNFFKHNVAGFAFSHGAIEVVTDAALGCRFRQPDDTYVTNPALTLVAGVTYEFLSFQDPATAAADDGFTIYSQGGSRVTSNSQFPNNAVTNAGVNPRVLSGSWQVPFSAVGTNFEYSCNTGTPVGTVSVVASGAGSTFGGVAATAWYNRQAYHAAAESVNVLDTILTRDLLNDDTVNIFTYNHPLPKTTDGKINEIRKDVTGFNIAINLMFGMSFLMASFVLMPVNERSLKAKHIQYVSGVTPKLYWSAAFAWDVINVIIPTLLILVVFGVFAIDAYTSGANIVLVFVLFMLFAWSALPLMYVLSFLFATSSMAFAVLSVVFIFGTMAMIAAVFVLLIPSLELVDTAKSLKIAFMVNPLFALCQGLLDMYYNYQFTSLCSTSNVAAIACAKGGITPVSYWSTKDPGVGKNLLIMFGSGCFYTLVLFFIEYKGSRLSPHAMSAEPQRTNEDPDVAAERARVQRGDARNDAVVVQGMTRVFSGGHVAVDHLSLGIPAGECFGLLGVNGAGKTTTFRMLTGELGMSAGKVSIAGFDVATQLPQVQQRLGYCPQYDGLIADLTGTEVLTMFGRLRGIPEEQLPLIVSELIALLDLKKHAGRMCGTYSGGNKRKLSTAIALIGDPPIVFLDEPTSGMDPGARRFLWDALVAVLTDNRSIVLTSHSMEECEALCTRLAIMVNGQFQCLGSPQHLKTRYGKGYTLVVKVRPTRDGPGSTAAIKTFVAQTFSGATLGSEYNGQLTYDVPDSHKWATLFDELERNKEQLNVDDYSVAQTSLEQIFLGFAAHQKVTEDDDAARKKRKGVLHRCCVGVFCCGCGMGGPCCNSC